MPNKLTGPVLLIAAFGGFFLALFLVFQVLDTEFFRGDPDLGGSAQPVRNPKTDLAQTHCAEAAIQQAGLDAQQWRALPEYTAWDIGFDRFLVKGAARAAQAPAKSYLCRVLNPGGGASWTVQSLEFLD
jgi:hypothetical protein